MPPSDAKALLLATTAPDGTSQQQTGSTNWTLRLCKTLGCRHQVTLAAPPPIQDPWLLNSGIRVLEQEVAPPGGRAMRFFKSLAMGVYPSIWTLYSPRTAAYLQGLKAGEFDICWLLDDYAGIYLRDIPSHLPTVFVRHYLFSMQEDFIGGNNGWAGKLKAAYHRRTAWAFDKWTTHRARVVTLGTQESARFLAGQCPGNQIEYLPTKPASKPSPTYPENVAQPSGSDGRLVATYLADMSFIRNAEGARWFLAEVLPLIPEHVRRKYHFQFIGRKPDPLMPLEKLPDGSSVEFTGFVDDLTAALHSTQVAFIPIFGGNGIRLKTLSLLGTGLPTVSTTDALEGLDANDGVQALVADTSESFASAFGKLLEVQIRLDLHNGALHYMREFLGEEEDAGHLLNLGRQACQRG